MRRHHLRLLSLLGILLIAWALRLYQLDAPAFRGDEAFSVQRWAATPLAQSLTDIASIEPHPPLTYIVFRLWGLLFGTDNEFALRLLPVLFNILGVPAIYALGRQLSGRDEVALLAAFVWALHPFQIWHAQDFRNYGIWAGLSVITLWLALRVIRGAPHQRLNWGLYVSFALASCLIFYNELLTIGVLGLYMLTKARQRPRLVLQWSVVNGAIIIVTILAFIIFQGDLLSGGGYSGTTGRLDSTQWWTRFIPVLHFGDTLSLSLQQQFAPLTPWWPLLLAVTALTMIVVVRRHPDEGLFLVMLAIIPLLMLGLIATQLNIFRPRYVLSSAPAYTLLLSYTVVLWWSRLRTRLISISILGLWLILSLISLNNYYHDPAYSKSPQWRTLITYLEENVQPDEVIIQTSVDPAFGLYYAHSDIAVPEFGLPANFDQPESEIIAKLEQTITDYPSLWILGQTFPDWPNEGVVEDWASENLQLIRETNLASLPVRQFSTWDVPSSAVASQPLAIFDGRIQLRGIEIRPSEITDTLTLIVYWYPTAQTDTSLTVFTQIIGGINPATGTPLWAQDDHPPQDGRATTDLWQVDQVYRDVFTLPLDGLPSGTYELWLGLYDPESGDRVLLPDGMDHYVIDTVTLGEGTP